MFFFWLGLIASAQRALADKAYWVWAGIAPSDAPASSRLYVYQGVVSGEKGQFHFIKKGIFAHPLKAPGVYLTYRVGGKIIDAEKLLQVFLGHADRWESHGVKVVGLQIDFDAPSAKLHQYAEDMVALKSKLPVAYRLSITGLADWARSADTSGLVSLFGSVDEIVFQMYRGRRHHENIKEFVYALENLRQPYKIGLLHNRVADYDLTKLNYLNGVVYFIQRKT